MQNFIETPLYKQSLLSVFPHNKKRTTQAHEMGQEDTENTYSCAQGIVYPWVVSMGELAIAVCLGGVTRTT